MEAHHLVPCPQAYLDDDQESCPVTPVNRNFPADLDPTFATAILSPSSNEVFAARTRARSRSEACLTRPLQSAPTPANHQKIDECCHASQEQDSSIERSIENSICSFNELTIETPDTSIETSLTSTGKPSSSANLSSPSQGHERALDKELLCLPTPARSRLLTVRRKSNTISMPAIKSPSFQDVFGPRVPVEKDNIEPAGDSSKLLERKTQKDEEHRPAQPRRMTIGSAPNSVLRPSRPQEKLRGRQSLCAVDESPVHTTNERYRESVIESNVHADAKTPSRDDSLRAFQQLIQSISKNRTNRSAMLQEVPAIDSDSMGAILEYRRSSPTSMTAQSATPSCELCGSVARRLTILEPCGHYACAACCSSGLNQVTASPPRAHVCAACHAPVHGITLHKGSESPRSKTRLMMYSPHQVVARRRPQTPSQEEQRMLFSAGHLPSSPLTLLSHRSGSNVKDERVSAIKGLPHARKLMKGLKIQKKLMEMSDMTTLRCSSSDGSFVMTDVSDSSEAATEDASFFGIGTHFSGVTKLSASRSADANGIEAFRVVTLANSQPMGCSRHQQQHHMPMQPTIVVRLDNIPWTVTYADIVRWLPELPEKMLPDSDIVAQAVHIPVDVTSGKTANCCFVECRNKVEAMRLVRQRNNSRLLGRPVSESDNDCPRLVRRILTFLPRHVQASF